MAQLKSRLMLEVNTCRVLLNTQVLPVNQHWFYIYALLALRFAEGNPVVGITELNRLPTWESVAEKSLRTSLFRHASEVSAGVITSPANERTKRFYLNPTVVSEVCFDMTLEEVSGFLKLDKRDFEWQIAPSDNAPTISMAANTAKLLGFAEAAFEQGRYPDTLNFASQILNSSAPVDDQVYALSLQAWANTFTGQRDAAWADIAQLQHLRTAPNASRSRVALTWIQQARFYLRFRDAKAARLAYKHASSLLEPHHHREWSAIHAGLGYLASWSDKHEECLRHSLLALEHASKASWAWSVQVQHANISTAYFRLYERLEVRQPRRALEYLTQAERWVRESMDYLNQMDFGGMSDNEVNLAFALRVQGKYAEANDTLVKAINVAKASENQVDYALIRAEQAELEEATGKRDTALMYYREAIPIFAKSELSEWHSACQGRLEELLGERPLTKPLKLW